VGVIHNDLKPENFVLIGMSLRLIDFGIANKIEQDHTSVEREVRCGTMNYMAPEAINTHEEHDYYKVGVSS
jgi:serine/threonine-protein kinase TTK/MPS1